MASDVEGGPDPAGSSGSGEQVIEGVAGAGAGQGEDPPAHRRKLCPDHRPGRVSSGATPDTIESTRQVLVMSWRPP
jgi:hypothetical protein